MRAFLAVLFIGISVSSSSVAQPVIYEGKSGAGAGKHIVLLAGDHEYRSEETVPALARILAKHHGFKCTVLFTVDSESGFIDPAADNIPGTEALANADLMLIFFRFKNLPDEQMQPIVDYLDRGGPVIGLRTSTHAFKIPADAKFAKYDFRYDGEDFHLGFGRQILGETWAGHYGANHQMSTRLDIDPGATEHPILRGVKDMWVQSGGYWTEPLEPFEVLGWAQPLKSMRPDAEPADDKEPCPGIWTRKYKGSDGTEGRVFTTTYGASEDLLNDGYRRCLINACFWASGLEAAITPELDISFVGPYNPSTFSFDGNVKEVRPEDVAGFDSPILQ